jgi:hypothetical protein
MRARLDALRFVLPGHGQRRRADPAGGRNGARGGYRSLAADRTARAARSRQTKLARWPGVGAMVEDELELWWSPGRVAGWLPRWFRTGTTARRAGCIRSGVPHLERQRRRCSGGRGLPRSFGRGTASSFGRTTQAQRGRLSYPHDRPAGSGHRPSLPAPPSRAGGVVLVEPWAVIDAWCPASSLRPTRALPDSCRLDHDLHYGAASE